MPGFKFDITTTIKIVRILSDDLRLSVRQRRQAVMRGQLFQNRYKSIICQEDFYLKELVRYIHLNPIRAGIINSLDELKSYDYCGHSSLMGKKKREWQDNDYVLSYFGKRKNQERKGMNHTLIKDFN